MTAGLAEREPIRHAFGTYVDRAVAEHILRSGTTLAGEEVEVTIMFVDVRGFTSFAERLRLHPVDVVAMLNRLYERIVPLVHEHGVTSTSTPAMDCSRCSARRAGNRITRTAR